MLYKLNQKLNRQQTNTNKMNIKKKLIYVH